MRKIPPIQLANLLASLLRWIYRRFKQTQLSPGGGTASIHPGRLAAESSGITRERILRALRHRGTPEALATAKLIKRGHINLRIVRTDPWGQGAAGRAPLGSSDIFLALDQLSSPYAAAGVAAHETRHVLQRLTPQTYRRRHEFEAYQWQRAADPGFNLTNMELWNLIHTNPLYQFVPS